MDRNLENLSSEMTVQDSENAKMQGMQFFRYDNLLRSGLTASTTSMHYAWQHGYCLHSCVSVDAQAIISVWSGYKVTICLTKNLI